MVLKNPTSFRTEIKRDRIVAVTEVFAQIPVDQQSKARALMLGKLNPNSSEHGRLETSLVVTPSASATKPSSSSSSQGKPRQAGEMNFFTYLNPLERDIVLLNYKAFPVSSCGFIASLISSALQRLRVCVACARA